MCSTVRTYQNKRATLTKRRCRLYTGPGGAAQLRNRSATLKRRGKCPLHSDLQTTVLIKRRSSTRTP
ncbi:hypothetical protein HHUSO_G29443 [Huso huso]|uniref:Uncharacterized protein n=1 Tax=Huso huso TaxID=61971 RepID=A0ABR0YGA5_HUSHU